MRQDQRTVGRIGDVMLHNTDHSWAYRRIVSDSDTDSVALTANWLSFLGTSEFMRQGENVVRQKNVAFQIYAYEFKTARHSCTIYVPNQELLSESDSVTAFCVTENMPKLLHNKDTLIWYLDLGYYITYIVRSQYWL